MHSATLDTAAAILLLSSVGSMGLLVKRTPKSRFASPTSVLSISDILSSILTALMVFFHHFYVNNGSEADRVAPRNNKIAHYGLNSTEFLEGSTSEDCDLKSVLFQYAMFFIPFINAFSSLLNFSFNCYSTAREIDSRCCTLICAQSDAEKNIAAEIANEPTEIKDVETKLPSVHKKLRIPKIFKIFRQKSKGLALLSQWLLPALFTGTFHLGEHRAVELATHPSEDLTCTVAANFPFENCMDDLEMEENIASANTVGTSSAVHNYVSSEDNLLWPNPNSSEVGDVLKKVLDVVQTVMNDSGSNNTSEGFFSMTQLLEVANDTMRNYDGSEVQLRSKLTQGRGKNENYDSAEGNDYLKSYFLNSEHLNVNEKFLNSERLNVNEKLQVEKCMKHRCVVSVRFLKIYLFVLLVLIYFVPILLSSLLLVVSYYKCREATKKIEDTKPADDIEVEKIQDPEEEETNAEGWFPAKAEETESSEQEKQPRISSKESSKIEQSCVLACETDKMQGFFRIFKVNLVCAVALWTPFFLQIISKVFFCSRVPNWITEVSFLAAMIFAVFRNAVNLNIVKMEADAENYKKQNKVHPNR